MNEQPLVSIVTPSYNKARFIEDTIESVLDQDYPRIEYIVMDGGSTDGTVDILRRYEGRLQWVSEPDDGQSDAVNKGFERSHGEIFAFLNADDTYLPGAVQTAVQAFAAAPDAAAVYGEAHYTSEDGSILRRYPTDPFDPDRLEHFCYICQPASFIRSSVFRDIGMLNPELHLALDYDLWLRLARKYTLVKVDRYLATARMYPENKTLSRRGESLREVIRITRRHCGYVSLTWLHGYAGWLLDGRDDFYELSPLTQRKVLLTFLLALILNRTKFYRSIRETLRAATPTPPV